MPTITYAQELLAVIAAPSADAKAALIRAVSPPPQDAQWAMPELPRRPGREATIREGQPPRRRRGIANPLARAQFLHAIWHIELSAIDLAVVCSLAGSGMPAEFHRQQLQVALEEAEHAQLVADLLTRMGRPLGHDAVHHRLWDSARACADLGEHLVVIPRFLEARGLDVNADLLPRLAAVDPDAHGVLQRIYEDEIGHVGCGSHWHRWWCQQQGIDPEQHFAAVLRRHHLLDFPNPAPLDHDGRRQAGFSDQELAFLANP